MSDAQHLSQVIFEYAGRIAGEQDRDALVEIIANMGRDLVGADRCTIWLVDGSSRQLVARFSHGIRLIPIGVDQGFVGRCVATGDVIIAHAAAGDPRFASDVDRQTGYRTTSVLTVPMRGAEGTLMGAFQALNKPGGFVQADADLLGLAAAYAARTIETQALLRRAEASRRVERELEIARDVQQRLLAGATAHHVKGLEFAGRCCPALEVGGDYYDLLPLPSNQVAVVIGDISGKGIAAALMMASVQATLHALILQNAAVPGQLMAKMSRRIFETSTRHYSTLFMALYDATARTLTTVNAGHCYPFILRNDELLEARAGGPPVGLLPDADYEEEVFAFGPGDSLICYSDGLSETQNADGEFWPEHRLRESVRAAARLPSLERANAIIAASRAFAAGAPPHDDTTVVCLQVTD